MRLRRSPWRLAARGLVVVMATLAFGMLGVTTSAGGAAWAAIALAAFLAAANSLGYAELAVGASRPGGAYDLVHRTTRDEAQAFLTGWAMIIAGAGLCAVLAQAFARYVAVLLGAFVEATLPLGLLATGVIAVVVLVRLFIRPRRRRGVVTILYLIGLAALTVIGGTRIQPANLRAGRLELGAALPPLMVAFVGLELITTFQLERRRRVADLPPAMMLTPGVAAVLCGALATVTVGVAGRSQAAASLAPLGLIGGAIAGHWARVAVLALAAIALLPALSQALSLVVRQVFAMSRDGFWPGALTRVNYRRRAPLQAIIVAGLLICPVLWLPGTVVSRVAGLLYLAVLISVNVTLARRPREPAPQADDGRPKFALPAHPWVPALVVGLDLLAVSLWGLKSVAYAVGCLGVGALIYVVYGRGRYVQAHEGVTVFRSRGEGSEDAGYSVLVPIANPATAGALLKIAGQLAQARGGSVIALRVEVVPEPLPLEAGRRRGRTGHALLEEAVALGDQEKWPLHTITRVARTAAEGVLVTAAEERVDLIVTGWRGPKRARETSLGSVLDGVLRDATCDVLVLRGEGVGLPKRILVPSAGGPHARAATRMAYSLAEAGGGCVTMLSVHTGPAADEQIEETRRRLAETLEGLSSAVPADVKVIAAPAVAEGIIQEAAKHDLVLLGVSEESLLDRLVFGSVPLQVAARVPATGLVQGGRGVTGVWNRRLVRALTSALPALDQREQTLLRQALLRGARPGTNYLVMVVLSCIIAGLGLLLGSPAVIIGAMLIAPLMSPIMAFSMGLVLGDLRMIRLSAEAILKGIALALLIAAFAGLVSPLKGVTDEMYARSRPTLLDLAVALASGLAGAYALARKDVSAALPGVAVAASLMPPLATVGLGLAMGQPQVAGGALLLFIANIAAISLAGGVVFLLLGVRPQTWAPGSRRHLRRRMIASVVMLVAVAVPLGFIFAGIVRDASQERTAEAILGAYLSDVEAELVGLESDEVGRELLIIATVRSVHPIGADWVDEVAATLTEVLGRDTQLDVVALPVVRSGKP